MVDMVLVQQEPEPMRMGMMIQGLGMKARTRSVKAW